MLLRSEQIGKSQQSESPTRPFLPDRELDTRENRFFLQRDSRQRNRKIPGIIFSFDSRNGSLASRFRVDPFFFLQRHFLSTCCSAGAVRFPILFEETLLRHTLQEPSMIPAFNRKCDALACFCYLQMWDQNRKSTIFV